jgi:hypothetical protein
MAPRAEPNDNSAQAEVRRDDASGLVQYGFVHNGAFHPVASERVGDYDERVQAAQDEDE